MNQNQYFMVVHEIHVVGHNIPHKSITAGVAVVPEHYIIYVAEHVYVVKSDLKGEPVFIHDGQGLIISTSPPVPSFMIDEAFPVAPASRKDGALQSACLMICRSIPEYRAGAFSPLRLAEVERIGLRSLRITDWQNAWLGMRMATLQSGARTSGARLIPPG